MARPRPVAVYYPGGGLGHCSTVKRAIARATAHLLDIEPSRKLFQVNILYDGTHVADLFRENNRVEIRWSRRWLDAPN